MNLIDYQRDLGRATDPQRLLAILRTYEPSWVADAVEIVRAMDGASFEAWRIGLMKERIDIWNPPCWYSTYGPLLNPPAYFRALDEAASGRDGEQLPEWNSD